MKSTKLEMPLERDVISKKEEPNKLELEGKSESELTNANANEDNRREEMIKIIKENELIIKENFNKKGFSFCKNISGKDSNYKGKKGNIKKYNKNNNKRNIINNKKNIYLIIIFFNVIIPNNNTIEYRSSNITLKIGGGNQYILHSTFYDKYPPNHFFVNGESKTLTSCQYNFGTTSVNIVK